MLHITVADDEAPIRDRLMYYIQKCEAASSITSVVNGEGAHRRILEQKPDVIPTDIHMLGMDELELMSKVWDTLPFTVLIILTNYVEFSYARQVIPLDTREYILKSEVRSSDIQRTIAEIAATTAKIRSKKVHDILQNGVMGLYEVYRSFEQSDVVTILWRWQGLWPGQPYLAFCVANNSSLDLRWQTVALTSASHAPFPAAAMVQEHLYLFLQCPEVEALWGYTLDTEAALGECRLSAGVPTLRTDIGQLIRALGEAAVVQEACFFTGGGAVLYPVIYGLLLIDWKVIHARKQEVLRLLVRRRVEEACGTLWAWLILFGMMGADDIRWAVGTIDRMVISMGNWYYQFVIPPADGWEPPHFFTVYRSRRLTMLEQTFRERCSCYSRFIETALNYIHAHYAQSVSTVEVAAQLYRSPEYFSRQFREEVGENFSSYPVHYRPERAQELLQTIDLSIASVAVQMGYTTPGYFSQLYKKYRSVSPEAGRRGSKS